MSQEIAPQEPSETCPNCGSKEYSHEWTDSHKIIRASCCGKLYRVIHGGIEPLDTDGTNSHTTKVAQ